MDLQGMSMADKRNATSSWSGYLHQGQAGLLVALREINRLSENDESLDGWFVIFENAEDFDIQNLTGVISRHQVKAYKDAEHPNAVKDVLGTQVYTGGALTSKGFQFKKLEGGVLTASEVDEDSRFLHVITEIKGFNLDEVTFNAQYSRPVWVANPHNIKLYEYENNKLFCPLVSEDNSTLEGYCLVEIEKYLTRLGSQEAEVEEYQRQIYYCIVNQLDLQIKNRHMDDVVGYPKLLLKDIAYLITLNPDKSKYFIGVVRRILASITNNFIADIIIVKGFIDGSERDRLENSVSDIYHLGDNDLMNFLKEINPNENEIYHFTTVSEVISVVKKDNFRTVFLGCLYRVFNSTYVLGDRGYSEHGGYILSQIVEDEMMVKSLKHRISENSMLTEAYFDKAYLINKDISDPDDITAPTNPRSSNWRGDVGDGDRFSRGNMKLIKLSEAIVKLNGEVCDG